ncbi:rho guanine nucleotide exchange factor 11 isoform X6 [Dromiciops gliroides]|uniref:rho guanine nucleotide exchange factor 11 isoform X6 n=1 Tax=Dromiciops gliroides TaxID=33562 RepID=UPI001CC5DF51|nr:rho guanine nucleotide exchange factor 11 isoform X6 [Dromiciops gliroides]XP_043857117.1 rho guanine nucleotide exchange factor 11 isoform X6 [Dromiciops gliroides]XP_043857118.1 rho guanine nucleotide exchange factor 11 isoform X6 [Dromiciops gliroides]
MSVRLPQTIDRLSNLSSLSDSAPEQKTPDHHRQPSDSCETTGLVQRCVIIQKDQHGFGFTVSGDRIVLVQSVRPGGAAMKAGVKEGDRIIKVNGTMVTNSSHLEVVKLIKSGAYVALTLLGSSSSSVGVSGLQENPGSLGPSRVTPVVPPPAPPLPPPPPQRITGPKPLQDPEVQKHAAQILQNMVRQEEKELQRLQEAFGRNPNGLLAEQIEGAQRRIFQLQRKIQQEMGGSVDILQAHDTKPANLKSSEGRHSLDSQDGDSGLDSGTERLPSLSESLLNRNSMLSDPGLDSPRTSPVIMAKVAQHHRRQGSDTIVLPATEQGLDHSAKPLIIGPEEDYDPGYFNNECDILFQDLEKLKYRPAHLGVFLRYIFSQADPNPLLFYLCAEVYLQTYPKDSRGLGKTIWVIFLEKNSPLRVKIPEALQAEIDLRLRNNEDIRSALSEAQEAAMPEIQEQIQDYRTKRTMGLGSLYGENDLMDLDGDPQRERQIAERQLAALGDILSKYEEDRSVSMDFALNTYMSHAGIRLREARPSTAEKSQTIPDKEKWLPFFPKTKKQSSNAKKEKDALEDKKRNPILKYIGKPKSSSQSIKPGNVRNIIQHFENNQQYDSPEPGMQRLSTGSFPEDLLESERYSRSEIRLGRSESLKGREEMKKSRKAENVPRSRSDVDMDAAAEATRLHQSASSSASSLSTRSLENPTPPFTPKMGRRSIESPSLGFCTDALLPHLLEDDLGQLSDLEPEPDAQNWQHTVGKDVVAGLSQREIDRQEVINELFVTEASHLRTLRVLDLIFYQRMKKENLMPREELARLFPNLPELIEIHNSWCEAMKKLREEGPVIKEISDLMLARFDGAAREELQQVAAQFCSYQSIALELIKTKQRKESRFQLFMQEAESNPQCRRLQLKDLIISEMQRLTKYPLLLENIIKYTDGSSSEYQKLCRARDQCREILKYVNEAVKQTENRQRLESYQKRLDTTSLERASNPLAAEFKSLDLTTRRMIHEGPLTWRISKDKTVDLHVLLLEDLLVLLQKQDEKLLLKCHSKTSLGSSDNKQTFSPVLKLNAVLIRSVATDKRAFFIICTSELGPPQIYELVALTSLDKNMWMELLEGAVQNATRNPGIVPNPSPQHPSRHSSTPTSMVLTDSEASQGNGGQPEVELLARGDSSQQWVNGKHQALLEEPEQEGSEEEPVAPTSTSSLGGGGPGIRTRGAIHLPLPGPLFMEGLADSALEDVENLRHLILWSLLPGHTIESRTTVEPEDDLTPTPSVIGITSHPWDPGSPGQLPIGMESNDLAPSRQMSSRLELETGELDDAALSSLEHLPPRARNSGIWEHPELDRDMTEEPPPTETVGSYKVVRKAEVAGSNAVPALPECGKSETEPPEAGGGPNAAGNCFYVSMPTGPPESNTDPSDVARSFSQQDAPHTSPAEPEHQRSSRDVRRGQCTASSLALRDVGMIFRTIEQLTLKLNRLKDMETAHRELLKSLGAESSGGTTPVGGLNSEAVRWTESSPSPPAKEPFSSYSKDSHEQGSGPEAGSDSLEDSSADTAISLGL